MIDFVKFKVSNAEFILKNDNLEFKQVVSTKTGELENYVFAEFNQMKFQYYQASNLLIAKGSIHKFYACADRNHTQFKFSNILEVLEVFEKEFKINLSKAILMNIEYGLNLKINFDPKYLLDNVLFHNTTGFEVFHNGYYTQAPKKEYIIKLYDKGEQYHIKDNGIKKNLLRFEVKYLKLTELKKFDFATMQDFKNKKFYYSFNQILLSHWDNIYYSEPFENSILQTNVNWVNPNYWKNIACRVQRHREKMRFRNFQETLKINTQKQIKEVIQATFENCING